MSWRRPLLVTLTAISALVLVLALFAAWTAATAGGLRFTVWALGKLIPADLEVDAPAGTLLDRLEFGRIRITTAKRRIEAEDVVLQWQPRHLLDGLLLVDALEAGSLSIASRPDDSPPEPPPDFGLPVAARIERLHVGRIGIDTLTDKGIEAGPELTAVEARIASDGRHHALETLRLSTARLAVEASATLDARPPFDLAAGARITGEERGHPFSVALRAGGSLEDMTLKAQSASGRLEADGEARIATFAPQPLRSAHLTATKLDPAAWVEGAPHAELRIEATLLPEEGTSRLRGEVSITNAAPGRLDEQRVPLRTLHASLREEEGQLSGQLSGRLQVPGFSAALVAGKVSGSALWADQQLAVEASLTDVDAAAWHVLLKKTRLAGDLKVQASAATQAVQAQLRDPRFSLSLDATRSEETIRIAEARVSSKGGSLAVKGEATPGRTYALEGQLAGFDPSVFVDVPRARLNAGLVAQGQLGEQTTMDLHFLLRDSVFAGHPLAGKGDVVWRGQEQARAELALRAGDNRIDAHGGLGEPKDELTVTIDAPRLDQVGLGGVLRGEVVLSGRLTAPGARWQVDAPRLVLPGDRQLQALASSGRWQPDSGSIQAALTIGSLSLEGQPVSQVSATLDGRRDRHRLEARAQVGEANHLALTASGGLDDKRIWTGQVETLAWGDRNPARLVSPTRLEAGPGHVLLGPAAIAGEDWQASVERLRWQEGRLESSGRFGGLPAALLLSHAAVSTTLRLGGEWNIDFGQRADGRVRVSRQSGDVVLKEGGQSYALGLERLDLSADFGGQQATLIVRGQGTQAGTLDGRLIAALRQEDGNWTLARQAPWQGKLALDTPSIAWLSPLAGENIVLGGRMQASVDLGGTPASPATNGQVSGSGLRVRLLDYGLDLGGGSLRLDFTPETARLQRLELISVATQGPRDRRLDFERLTGQPGVLSAEGEMALKSGSGRIQLHAERLVVSDLPDRWLMVSGTGDLRLADGKLAVDGDVGVDAAYIELPPAGQPTLSSDVVVLGREKKQSGATPARVDLTLDLGRRFYFQGAGVNSRLKGQLHLTADNRGQLRARGSVQTVEGKFEAYGRELAIERGILNFQGQVDNPGLNVLALRKNLSVEAGVEVIGTVKEPRVRLVSVPDVPDSEKLSWMVLGHPPSQALGAQDADLLLSAAMAMRGNQGKGPLDSLMQQLRLEELGISSGTLAESSRFASSHVAGSFTTDGTTAAQQIATVGKRIGSNTVLSYERSLTSAESILKLTVELTRRLSAFGRVGADNAVGLTYSLRFGGGGRKPEAEVK
jgi:translocation and assembly module TamB